MSEPDQKEFSELIQCDHCHNKSRMELVHRFSQVKYDESYHGEHGPINELLLCAACDGVILRRGYWDEHDPGDAGYNILYPNTGNKMPLGLPTSLQKPYEAAVKVKSIDPNAYAVLVGRLLELVCVDREATGDTLGEKFSDLASCS